MPLAYIPSPSSGVVHLGPLPLRAYAGCILLGVLIAVWVGNRRWVARGGQPGFVADMATIAVPAGLVGARIYHVVTDPSLYLKHPVDALYVWHGGLGIWGGVAGGAVAAWLYCRHHGVSFSLLADSVAPGLALAQAAGRFGNYFNQELYGRPSTLPWALKIDHPDGYPDGTTFHPTFLYESIWDVGVALLVIWAGRRWQLDRGRVFALYVAAYTVGRAWIEALRIDTANRLFGLRLNDYVSVVVFACAAAYLYRTRRAPAPTEERETVSPS